MPFNSALELLIAIMGKPNRVARKEHRRQGNVEREGCMVASAEAAAEIGKLSVDARRLEGGAGFAQEECNRTCGLVW